MRKITLFHVVTEIDPDQVSGPQIELKPDTEICFFLEQGHVMEYFLLDSGERVPVLFYGPGEFVYPSHPGLSCFEELDTVVRIAVTYGQVIRALRNLEGACGRYRKLQDQQVKKEADMVHLRWHLAPLERFTQLKATQPWVLKLAKKKDVAAYLGIRPWVLDLFLLDGDTFLIQLC